MSENLRKIIDRVKAGNYTPEDVREIFSEIYAGKLVLASSSESVGIGGDAPDAKIVTGKQNVTGDGNTVIYICGEDAQAIQSVMDRDSEAITSNTIASIDELVQQVRSRLHNDIQCLYGTMPLWGMSQPVALSDLFVDVNLLEEPNSDRRDELGNLWQDFQQGLEHYSRYRSLDRIGLGRELKRVSGLEILATIKRNGRVENPKLMVLGKPGSGKTTYLQRIATECNAGELHADRVPVLIQLRRFVKRGAKVGYNIKSYLVQQWQLSEVEVEKILREGKAFVLLDGLDEITGKKGHHITEEIQEFIETYPQNSVLITCRTQSHNSQFLWKNLGFRYIEVADFDRDQVVKFTEHWFEAIAQNTVAGRSTAADFLEQLFMEENKPIQELTITPILLSLTCAVFHQTGKFYSKRSQLYEEGLELLLERWDKLREIDRGDIYRDLSIERKLELLIFLAVKKFEQEQYVLFEQEEIEEYISEFLGIGKRESRAVLRSIESQHGLLIERSQKIWSFSHMTFQEYLVAIYFAKIANWESLTIHVIEHRWREVFLLVVNIMQNSNILLQAIKHEIDNLLNNRKFQIYLNWLIEKASSLPFDYNQSALRSLILILVLDDPEELMDLPYNLGIDLDFISGLPHNPSANERLISEFVTDRNLRLILSFASNSQNFISLQLYIAIPFMIRNIIEYELSYVLPRDYALEKAMQESANKFPNWWPDNNTQDSNRVKEWWRLNGEEWTKNFRGIVINYRNFGHDWQFDDEQKNVLQQYYDANKLLIDCLNSSCNVNYEIRRDIEENLILPIAEIEKRKCVMPTE